MATSRNRIKGWTISAEIRWLILGLSSIPSGSIVLRCGAASVSGDPLIRRSPLNSETHEISERDPEFAVGERSESPPASRALVRDTRPPIAPPPRGIIYSVTVPKEKARSPSPHTHLVGISLSSLLIPPPPFHSKSERTARTLKSVLYNYAK